MRRNRAHRPVAEVLCFDAECVIITRAVVFPRDCGRQFDEFGLTISFTKPRKERVGNFDRGIRHCVRILKHQVLEIAEMMA